MSIRDGKTRTIKINCVTVVVHFADLEIRSLVGVVEGVMCTVLATFVVMNFLTVSTDVL